MRRALYCTVFALTLCGTVVVADDTVDDRFYTLRVGDPMPGVDFALGDGTKVSRNELLGRTAVVDFWATWCAPCVAAFPRFNELEREFSDRPIAFYSVTYESPGNVQSVLEEQPLETEVGFDHDFSTFRAFRAWGIPVTYIFSPEGVLLSALHPENLTSRVLESALAGEIPDVEQTRGWPDPEGAEEHFRSLLD